MQLMIRGAVGVASLVLLASAIVPLHAQQQIRIEVQNNQAAGGFFLTPVWIGLHNGSFDFFDLGSSASNSTELLAEDGVLNDGMGGGIINDFNTLNPNGIQSVITGPSGFGSGAGQPPVLDPGESFSVVLQVNDAMLNRFLSFGSMVIPSNDAFIGNDSGTEYELFDAAGNFNGTRTIQVIGNQIWDAGTEVNDGQGAAFSTNGGTGTTENLLLRVHPGLDNFIGTGTAAGTTITSGIGPNESVATFTITAVPEPSGSVIFVLVLVGVACCGLVSRRRRVIQAVVA